MYLFVWMKHQASYAAHAAEIIKNRFELDVTSTGFDSWQFSETDLERARLEFLIMHELVQIV